MPARTAGATTAPACPAVRVALGPSQRLHPGRTDLQHPPTAGCSLRRRQTGTAPARGPAAHAPVRTESPARLRAHQDGRGAGDRERRPPAQAGADVRDHEEARQGRRAGLRRRRARGAARRLRLPALDRGQLHGVDRRHLPVAEPDPPLQPAHRRHGRRRGARAQGRRALLRAGQGRPRERPDARGEQAQDHVREPDAPVPEGAVQARARHQGRREHHQPHHRPDRADRQRPARAAGLAAQERQDDDHAAPGACDRRQPPRRAPDRAAGRRAARGSDRDAAHGARRGHQLDLRRAGRAPRAGGRDGDRARQAPGRAEEGRGDPARQHHPPGARLQQRAALVAARC